MATLTEYAGRNTKGIGGKGRMFPADAKMSTVDAIELAGMDDGITVRPVTTSLEGGMPIETGMFATVRLPRFWGDKPEVFGVNTAQFTPLPNRKMAEILDASGLSEEWPIYSVGAFDGGKRAFYCYELGNFQIGGEDMEDTIIFLNGHDGGRGLSMFYSNTRLICDNQTSHAETNGRNLINIAHKPSIARDFAISIDVIQSVKLTREQIIRKMNRLTEIKVTDEDVKRVLEAAYPTPERSGQAAIYDSAVLTGKYELMDHDAKEVLKRAAYLSDNAARRALQRRIDAMASYERLCDDRKLLKSSLRGTGWALYNAVTEQENHRPDRRKDAELAVFQSIITGERAQTMSLALSAILN